MTEKPLVSVIINCYNGEKYLRETIDSVLAQTYENWELVFWDNQSTDSTRNIVESYKNPKILYFYAPKHTSLGEARNQAIEIINGEYVSFLDSDDLLEPKFLEECISAMIESYAGFVYTRFIYFDDKNSWPAISYQKDGIVPTKRLIESYNIGMSAALFRSGFIKDLNFRFDNRFSLIEDFDFFIRIAAISPVYYIQEPLMRYRCHSNNLSHSDRWVDEMDILYNSVNKGSDLYEYKPCIKRRREIYEYQSILRNEGKSAALRHLVRNVWHNYKLIKYIIIQVFGESLYKKLNNKAK